MPDRMRSLIVAFLSLTTVLVLLPTVVQAGPVPNCVGAGACFNNTGDIGEGACIGVASCRENSGDVAKNGCHEQEACALNDGSVGEGACHGLSACNSNKGDVRKASCIGSFACLVNSGSVGGASCIGVSACEVNTGGIGKLSCRGDHACISNIAPVGDGSCNGTSACESAGPGPIGRNACNGERACFNNSDAIPKGTCNGPFNPATGKGVCEADPAPCQVIGHQLVDIRDDPARLSESAMGNLVADAMRLRYPGTDAALTNSGGLRADLLQASSTLCGENFGEITWGEAAAILPFTNQTVIETVTGAQLTTALANGLSPVCDPAILTGRFPQVSGLKVLFHCNGTVAVVDNIWKAPSGPAGPLTLLGPGDTVRLVTNDFLFTGGDGYTVLAAGTNVRQPGDLLLDILVAEIKVQSTPPSPGVSAAVEGRIVRQ